MPNGPSHKFTMQDGLVLDFAMPEDIWDDSDVVEASSCQVA